MQSRVSRYWPFDVGDRGRHSEQVKREVRFLEEAHRLGYRPFEISLGMQSLRPGSELVVRSSQGVSHPSAH
jgi:hypothetical protein